MPDSVKITITEEDLPCLGGSSLLGLVVEKMKEQTGQYALPTLLVLEFPQTTLEAKTHNKGPAEFIVYEHTVPCILEDVIRLVKDGVDVKITMPEVLPK